ncbi:MAG TPA: hypothetical protein VMW47_02615 [Verrucomicrobiae bacterium]|nr:hypothetical protein [Verrucomicrobiae bacterium]
MRSYSPGPPLTTKQATAVVKAYDQANSKASFTLNTTLQGLHEEGVTARIDGQYFRALRLMGKHSAAPGATPPVWSIAVIVPHQTTTPAEFLALISLPGHSSFGRGLLVLRKDAHGSNWRTDYEIDLPPGATLPPVAPRMVTPSRSAVAALAAYWQAASRAAAPLGDLLPGRFTTQLTLGLRTTNASTLSQHHARETERIAVDPARPLAFRLQDGGQLVCAALDVAFRVRAAPGSGVTFVQPAGRSTLPPFLAPGRYTGFTEREVFEVALVVPPQGRGIQVVGLYDQLVGASGAHSG